MKKICFNAKIGNKNFDMIMRLEGQDLYFFEQRSDEGKQLWIKDYIKRNVKINDIEIVE